MRSTRLFAWKEAPFLRFIPPFIFGILIQWYTHLPLHTGWFTILASSAGLALFSRFPVSEKFRFRFINGLLLNTLLLATGFLLAWYKDIRHQQLWFPHYYTTADTLLATIEEPLQEKAKTYSTTASLQAIIKGQQAQPVIGKLLFYFHKGNQRPRLQYGNQIMFIKTPEPIRNTANPGAFDFEQYCAFKNIYHQVYLREHEFITAEKMQFNPVKKVLYYTRENLLNILRENIAGKKQAGLAEALLLGYKDDLDKQLLLSYINTGVVHVIAVSGLHLGLIYAILILLCNQFPKRCKRWVSPIIIISSLWLFAFLAGASPSVLRAAIMFTCLVIGNQFPYHSSAYNSLAVSAFLLLCYDPRLCWDIGFQLSYAAVFSILLFMKPVYQILSIKNKYLNYGWKLIAVTLAAQILTLPISMYHFHQFPNLFLVTNLIAVPLSSLILGIELAICAFSFIPFAAKTIGWLLGQLIRLLNYFIEIMSRLPYTTTDGIQISPLQVALLYVLIFGITTWLLQKKKNGLLLALASCWLFFILYAQSWHQANNQQKLIVYNVPQHQAIDFISGHAYVFKGDSLLLHNPTLTNFHLKPSRTAHRTAPTDSLSNLLQTTSLFKFGNITLLIVDQAIPFLKPARKIPIDIIILSHNPNISAKELTALFDCRKIVIDPTNSPWKTRSWLQDCRKLGISCHSVTNQGAFVLTLH